MGYWLRVQDSSGHDVYVNMDLAVNVQFMSIVAAMPDSERAKVTFVGGEWVTVANRKDVTMLRDWVERQ